jgi:hypothetical protein
LWPVRFLIATSISRAPSAVRLAAAAIVAVSDCSCANVARAVVSSSLGCATTPSSARYRLSMWSMKKFPPAKTCRLRPARGSPRTEATGIGSATSGM